MTWGYAILNKTIIRLKDNAPGFGVGADKAVLAFYLLRVGSERESGQLLREPDH